MDWEKIKSTKDIKIPKFPIDRVIGQDEIIEKVKIAVKQRRHLLLVGPPGVGKSMIAQAIALALPRPKEEIRVVHNPKKEERPLLEIVKVRDKEDKKKIEERKDIEVVTPQEIPTFVAEQLGFRCPRCGEVSSPHEPTCQKCGSNKFSKTTSSHKVSPFGDVITDVFQVSSKDGPEREVAALKIDQEGNEKIIIYQRVGEKVYILDEELLEKIEKEEREGKNFKVLVPGERIPFVQASGASETELLGDVRHDPYGSHPEIGTPSYLRVVPGAIHEAHEGVLFIDELTTMAHLQSFILTAMEDKKFPITGRNPHSAGASVKVEGVPCEFIFVGACNIKDVNKILPALRSRIIGNGYELLLKTTMEDNERNQGKIAQFIAQEIERDGRIPPAKREVVLKLIEEGKRRAEKIDGVRNALTLRLRDLGGLIHFAGDLAMSEGSKFIEKKHIEKSILECKPIEYQIKDRYGSVWSGIEKDSGVGEEKESYKGYG